MLLYDRREHLFSRTIPSNILTNDTILLVAVALLSFLFAKSCIVSSFVLAVRTASNCGPVWQGYGFFGGSS